MIAYNGINHLAMATRDIDATIRFWRDLLGMRLIIGLGRPGYRHYFFEISPRDTIAFFEWPDVEPLAEKDHGVPVVGPFIFDHVSIGVEKEEDLWEVKDRLDAAGFWVSELVNHGFIHSVYSFDPNGIAIEFSHAIEGVDLRQHPRMVDTSPSAAALEGPLPRSDAWPPVEHPTPPEERSVYPGEGENLLSETKKNWYASQEPGEGRTQPERAEAHSPGPSNLPGARAFRGEPQR